MKPRVAIDCSPLLVRSAGVKVWLYYWVRALRAVSGGAIRTILEPPDTTFELSERLWAHPFRLAWLQALRHLPPAVLNAALGDCDVFHASNLMRSVPSGRRISATLHDLTAWKVPECHQTFQVRADHEFAERVLRRADGLIAVSAHTRNDAVEILGLKPEKIRVIYPGVAEEYFCVTEPEIEAARSALGIERPYFFFNGTLEPRKNIPTLLNAWMLLPAEVRRSMQLILAGMPGWSDGGLSGRLRAMEAEGAGVKYLGYVRNGLLPGLMAGAMALVYPSYYEGFGLPVAQAMACGLPVVISNTAALPEVSGGVSMAVDPRSPGELAAAMFRLYDSSALRGRLSEEGRQRAKLFRWQRAAEESVQYFEHLAG